MDSNSANRLIAPMSSNMRISSSASQQQQQLPTSAQVSSILRGGRMNAHFQQQHQHTFTTNHSTSNSIPATIATNDSNSRQQIHNNFAVENNSGIHDYVNIHTGGPIGTNLLRTTSDTPITASSTVGIVEKQQPRNNNNQQIPRAQFCQYDILACINCFTDDNESTPEPQLLGNAPSTRKLGPLLLDLRRLHYRTASSTEISSSLFSTTIIAQSRGNPSLGSSIYSTCLTVPSSPDNSTSTQPIPNAVATGLSTGALCIHSFAPFSPSSNSSASYLEFQSSLEYYQLPRNNRPATAIAWRPNSLSHVAIGYVNSSGTGTATTGTSGIVNSQSDRFLSHSQQQSAPLRRSVQQASANMAGGGLSSNQAAVGDRQYCCFLWDVEHQSPSNIDESTSSSPPTRRNKSTPLYKLSHNQGVSCLSWIVDESGGQILAVGGQQRNIQLYDLRLSGSTAAVLQPSPNSSYCHSSGVHGIESDPTRPWHFCTYASSVGEVIKIWDARRMESPLAEIKPLGTKNTTSTITAAKWSTLSSGQLSILVGENILSIYDTNSTSTRPSVSSSIRTTQPIVSFTNYPYSHIRSTNHESSKSAMQKSHVIRGLFPRQIVAIDIDQSISVIATECIAPLAVSPRTGQIVHSIGQSLFLGSTTHGPTAMEGARKQNDEDISKTILSRAQGTSVGKYSMDISTNIEVLTEELINSKGSSMSSRTAQLLRLWKWIQLAEGFCQSDVQHWPSKSLVEAGVTKLLQLDNGKPVQQSKSESLNCLIYESEGRRAALASCGWAGMFDLQSVMTDCESGGEYERSAALAVWHGRIELAVDALERGAIYYASKQLKNEHHSDTYSETLEHVALSVAGYQGGSSKDTVTSVWRRSCAKLLQRSDLSVSNLASGACYLRHILIFLMTIGNDTSHTDIIDDTSISLCDRVAFGCHFLNNDDLKKFLDKCIAHCQSIGNVEGLCITGINTQGIEILQGYVDVTSDVQTAALVTSRVILPSTWLSERDIVAEWLYSYRTLLNRWQMWQCRAMFDVDRASVLRVVKQRQLGNNNSTASSRNRQMSRLRSIDTDVQATVPAQIDARCNYCSAPLGLRRQDQQPHQWLSKMKNVLPCCARCRKPLPRCAICMLSLGAPNPYHELTKERPRGSSSLSSSTAGQVDDLSSLANLPFAEWFSWCMRCKHGGHAHHIVGWFAKHEICPVSGCTCHCEFDGIRELHRTPIASEQVTPTHQ